MDTKTNTPLYIMIAATALVVIGGVVAYAMSGDSVKKDTYNELAQCITDSGAKFYGAYWCPHCQDQKKAFGSAVKLLPYVECSTPDGKGQTQACIDAGITSYPTWEFPDGTRVTGNIALKSLAEATDCEMPAE